MIFVKSRGICTLWNWVCDGKLQSYGYNWSFIALFWSFIALFFYGAVLILFCKWEAYIPKGSHQKFTMLFQPKFFSPPVHIARWLICITVCLSWPQGCWWLLGASKYPLIGYFFLWAIAGMLARVRVQKWGQNKKKKKKKKPPKW